MEDSPFNKIAAELRNRIYEDVLTFDQEIGVDGTTEYPRFAAQASGNRLALTATCKQLRQESLPLFYSSNVFNFQILRVDLADKTFDSWNTKSATMLKRWLQGLETSSQFLRSIKIHLGEWHSHDSRNDGLIRRLPVWIKEYQTVVAQTKIRLEVRLGLEWTIFATGRKPKCILGIVPSDVPQCRKDVQAVLQDDENLVSEAVKQQPFVGPFRDIVREQAKSDLKRTRQVLSRLLDSLESTDFEAC